jgi:Uma2 family endonuclease
MIFNKKDYFCKKLNTMIPSVLAPQLDKIYSVDEYFELEKHSDIRYEFVNGKLTAMPGESIIANRIAGNCDFQLQLTFRKQGYDVIRHDVRTIVKPRKIYRYPDVVLALRSDIVETHAITKPILLIEVTSDNSAKVDNDTKVSEYTNLDSTQYYLIIAQDEPQVKVYSRDELGWRFKSYDSLKSIINLPNLDFSLKMADIYENVIFAESKTDSE